MGRARVLGLATTALIGALGVLGSPTPGNAAAIQPVEPDWGAVEGPAPAPARAIGGYSRGCLGGAVALPASGPGYQVMRLSRHRYYGHPELIAFIRTFAKSAQAEGWPGLLVGDMAQARGGPILSGHASHQSGLDVDIWFTPAPRGLLGPVERESMSAISMVAAGGDSVDKATWSDARVRLLKTAANSPEVDRIFVNAAIKRAVCDAAGKDRGWLAKIRPWYGHTYHFHVRLRCPAGDGACVDQEPLPVGDGCDASLDWWFSEEARAPAKPGTDVKPRRLTLTDLPAACRGILYGG